MSQERCEACNGTGQKVHLNLIKAKTEKVTCDECHGTGMKQVDPKDFEGEGLRVATVHCQVVFFQWFVGHDAVATLELRVFPLLDAEGKPKTLGTTSLLYAEIPRMHTRSKHRKKGYMSKCLEGARADPRMTRLETSWNDSPADGRNFLISRGFKQDGDILLWRQGMDKEA